MGALDVKREQLREQRPALSDNEIQMEIESVRDQLAALIEEQAQVLIEQWRIENPGRELGFEDNREVQNRARMIANEVLSDQLRQEQLSAELTVDESEDPVSSLEPVIRPGSAVHQWMHEDLWVPASRDSDRLAEKLWPGKEPAWIVRAAGLIEARSIDGLSLPSSPGDPVALEVAAAVEADLSRTRS